MMITLGLIFVQETISLLKLMFTFIIIEMAIIFTLWGIQNQTTRNSTISHTPALTTLANSQQKRLKVPKNELSSIDIEIANINEQVEKGDFRIPTQLIRVEKSFPKRPVQLISVINSETIIKTSEDPRLMLFSRTNLNDLRHINGYLSTIFKSLKNGGFAILRYVPLEMRRQKVKAHRLDFLVHRAFPRIPILEWLYFIKTKGRNRALSRAEVWGRLKYCGFDVIKEEDCDGFYYILVRKHFEPSKVTNPSHYPIIKLDRVGLGGEIIKIHKVRTMHPYSEFIQQKIFEMFNLSSTGKFKEDFRITGWGKVLRRYWLDELPQVLDWLQGNIKIVGIRAMSLHYFSLYPKRYQEKYYKVKPGFLSPIFNDKNDSFNNIIETEERYLDDYLQKPLSTDFKLLIETLSNIFIKGARSY